MVGQALALLREHVDVANEEVGGVTVEVGVRVGVWVLRQLQALEILCKRGQQGLGSQESGKKRVYRWAAGCEWTRGLFGTTGKSFILEVRFKNWSSYGVARYGLQKPVEVLSYRLIAL